MDPLAPNGFQDDPRVCVALGEPASRAGAAGEAWIPERLFARLLHLAAAYHLHALGTVDLDLDTRLGAVQCESLLAELEFLAQLLPSDVALQGVLAEVVPLVARASRSGGSAALVVSPP